MIQTILKQKQLDGIVITSRVNRIYYSGFTGTEGLILLTPGESFLFVDGRYTLQAKQQAKGFTVMEYKLSPFKELEKFHFTSLGYEDKTILHSTFLKLPKCNLVGVSEDLDALRMVKTPEELKNMQVAADIADNAFQHILGFIKPGMTEIEVANELEFYMRKNGASGLSFDTIVAAGPRSALPHAYPSDKVIEKGSLLLMDYGCVYKHYCSDMTRTVAVGAISQQEKAIYQTVLQAQLAASQAVRPGISGKELDAVARDIITAAGYGDQFGHSLGHGVGLEIHEEPRVSPRSAQTLKENMVVTIEPGIYVPELSGVRIEDMVYVTADGCHSFTSSPKELIQV